MEAKKERDKKLRRKIERREQDEVKRERNTREPERKTKSG